METPCNIAASLPRLARERGAQVAMRCPGRNGRYDVALTYADLDARSDAIAAGLAGHGIARGTRTVVMVRPTPEFFLLMFALFKAGAVPVLVDPGIDRRALRQCLDEAQPEAFIGWGLRDFVFDKHCLDAFTRAWPQAEVQAFDDANHYVLEDKYEILVPRIRNFLEHHPLAA